jgi:DNA modification methylase
MKDNPVWPDDYLIPGIEPFHQEEAGIIYCGDSSILVFAYDNKLFNATFADPPYGINKAPWDKEYPMDFEKELLRISLAVYITPGQENIGTCINALGGDYKGIIAARNKNGMTFNKVGFGNWIPIICGGAILRGQDFYEFTVNGDKPKHPSPKPYDFMRKFINRFIEDNGVILDPFLGSGTTAVAAKELGRKFIGIEISEEYCKIAVKRLRQGVLNFEG